MGGPVRGLLGALAGHIVHHDSNNNAQHQIAFTIGVIALGAKMAKADGVVTRDEIIAFKEVFKVPEGEMENVSRVFNLAKQDVIGYEAYANQLASLLKGNCKLLEDVLEGLFHIAVADGVFHPNEERFLADVAQRFGLTRTQFNYIKARHVSAVKSDPYEVLGIAPDIDDDTLKSHYHRLVLDNHPDKISRVVCRRNLCRSRPRKLPLSMLLMKSLLKSAASERSGSGRTRWVLSLVRT